MEYSVAFYWTIRLSEYNALVYFSEDNMHGRGRSECDIHCTGCIVGWIVLIDSPDMILVEIFSVVPPNSVNEVRMADST